MVTKEDEPPQNQILESSVTVHEPGTEEHTEVVDSLKMSRFYVPEKAKVVVVGKPPHSDEDESPAQDEGGSSEKNFH